MSVTHALSRFICTLGCAAVGAACFAQTEPEPEPPAPVTTSAGDKLSINMLRKAGDSQWLAEEMKGSAKWLEAAGTPFLALWEPHQNTAAKGAVLMLHGEGQTANGNGMFTQLRQELPKHGWATLSISLPVPQAAPRVAVLSPATSTTEDAAPPTPAAEPAPDPEAITAQRINAAVAFLQQQGASTSLVVLGEGAGALRAARFASQSNTQTILALVLLNARNSVSGEQGQLPEFLNEESPPMLDLYSGAHLWDTEEATARRMTAERRGLQGYRQLKLGPASRISTSSGLTAGSRRVLGFLRQIEEQQ